MSTDTVKCVVFDFAFTLCSDFFCKVTPPECPDWFYQFQRRIWSKHSPWMHPWMSGEIGSREIAEMMTRYIPMPAKQILATMEAGCRKLEFNPAVLEFAKAQRAQGRRTALVTLNVDLFSRVVVPAHGLDGIFDVIVNSAEERDVRKDRLWETAFRRLGTEIGFHNSFLIDDAPQHVRRFAELGGGTYEYTTDAAFADWVAQGGVRCRPTPDGSRSSESCGAQ